MSRRRILESESHSPFRARIVAAAMGIAFVGVAVQGAIVSLTGPKEVYASSTVQNDKAQAIRADILDRNGERLATSIPVYSLYADPSAVWDPADHAAKLAEILPGVDQGVLQDRLSDPERKFVWIKRELTPLQRQDVYDLGLEGIGFLEENRRFYPQKTVAAHLIGFTDIDGKGLSGMEYALDERLTTSMEPVRLTIDLGVQYSLEAELGSMASQSGAKGGAGVVMDARTGEVLAMASWPFFDPNRRQDFTSNELKDRATSSVFELGSVFKPLTIAAGLDHGLLSPTETFNVSQPVTVNGQTIHDDHPLDGAHAASVTNIIAHSSNIGTVQIGLRLGEERQQRFLDSLGLMERAPIELASSANPLLPPSWSDLTTATVSFGHGINVTPIAFTAAFASFANEGTYIPPTVLLDHGPLAEEREPRRVMSTPTAAVVVEMMRVAVESGTGRKADVPGYRVAGKTGTAEKAINGRYDPNKNLNSFAAVFPADDPKYAVLIVLDEPTDANGRPQTAAFNAAPAVGRVIDRIATILDVMPNFEDLQTAGPPVRTVADRRSL